MSPQIDWSTLLAQDHGWEEEIRLLQAEARQLSRKAAHWVDTAVDRFAQQWASYPAVPHDPGRALAAWEALLPSVRREAMRHLTTGETNPALDRIAGALFDTFVGGLGDRRIKPAMASDDPLGAYLQVPTMLAVALNWVATRVASFESLRGQALTKAEPSSELLPEGYDGHQRYRILTAGDDRVCPVCEYMEGLSGSFRLTDAVSTFDAYLQAWEDGVLDTAIEDVGIPKMDDIEGLGVQALSQLGWDLPPFHPRCRCSVVLV
jgi:hypothetical protein